jgi:hypothetical protein
VSSAAASALLCAALAWPALAAAKTHSYNGPAASGRNNAGVEFGARFRKGRARSVFRFEFHNVPANCKGFGTTAVTEPLARAMKVGRRRRFGQTVKLNSGRLTVHVSGRFARDWSKAGGTLRATGTVPGCPKADTGVVRWHAPRTG